MTAVLLSIHVVAAILTVGPIAVAASIFPAATRRARADSAELPVLRTLHRICRVYALIGVLGPLVGLAVAQSLGVLRDAWLIVSIALTVVAVLVLGMLVLPTQLRILDGFADTETTAHDARDTARLAMVTGIFNLLWVVVTVLMIFRPGSTTGV